jgi:uncharacterized protein
MGKVQHFELPADDVGRAKDFYGSVFGWTFDQWDPETLMIHPGGAEGETGVIGGDIYKRSTPTPPTVVITVDSIEDALDLVIKAGGTRLGAIETLGDSGRYAYFTDSEGNRVGLWDEKKP